MGKIRYFAKKIKNRIKYKIREFLDIRSEEDVKAYRKELSRVHRAISELLDASIMGVDLGYRDESEIIIVKYSRINNAFKVIGNTNSRFKTYHDFIREMRHLCSRFNVEEIAIDAHTGVDQAALRAKILPDRALTDMYEDRL